MYKSILFILTICAFASCKRQTIFNDGCFSFPKSSITDLAGYDRVLDVWFHPENDKLFLYHIPVENGNILSYDIATLNYVTGELSTTIKNKGLRFRVTKDGKLVYYADHSNNPGIYHAKYDGTNVTFVPLDNDINSVMLSANDSGVWYFSEFVNNVRTLKHTDMYSQKTSIYTISRGFKGIMAAITDTTFLTIDGDGIVSYDLTTQDFTRIVDFKEFDGAESFTNVSLGKMTMSEDKQILFLNTAHGCYSYNFKNGAIHKLVKNCESRYYHITDAEGQKVCGFYQEAFKSKGIYSSRMWPFIGYLNEDYSEMRRMDITFPY